MKYSWSSIIAFGAVISTNMLFGYKIIISNHAKNISIRNLEDGKLEVEFDSHQSDILAFNLVDRTLITSDHDFNLYFWDIDDELLIRKIKINQQIKHLLPYQGGFITLGFEYIKYWKKKRAQ